MGIQSSNDDNIFNILNYDSFLEVSKYLEPKDLASLASSCKILQATQAIWDAIALQYRQPLGTDPEKLIQYLNTPMDVTVYHLVSGVNRRSLSKNHYTVYPTTKLTDIEKVAVKNAVQELMHETKDEEHCEVRLPRKKFIDTNNIPVYAIYKQNKEPIVVSKEKIKQSASNLAPQTTIYSIPSDGDCDISTFLTSIYNAITEASDLQFTKAEIGPFGLFSLEGLKWRPLNSIEFFKQNHQLNDNKEMGSLKQKTFLVITDISHTEQDTDFDIVDEKADDDRNDRYSF